MNLNIGPLAFQLVHILAFGCVLLGNGVGWLVGKRRQIGISDVVLDMTLVAVPTGRAMFVALWFTVYQDDPWSIFDIRDGGFELWSATAAALLMAIWRVLQRPDLLRPLVAGLSAGLVAWSVLLFTGFSGAPPTGSIPALSLTSMNGVPMSLTSAAHGRAMVVNLWATWCPPCQREMPALARAQTLHPKILFLFVNEGESPAVVQQYLHIVPFGLEHVLVDQTNLLGKAMNSSALPMTLIYGADGQLTFSHQGLISEAVLAMHLERCCQH